jgi:putative ABC transport system ATP-binding protein
MKSDIIKTINLDKTYHDNGVPVHALRSVSMSVDKGEFTVIAGPSGSGKTTLLNLMGALDKPTNGEVLIEGQDVSKLSKKGLATLRLNKLGFIFQAYNLIPVLSALENIEFTMMLLGVPDSERKERSMHVMEELGIADLAHKRPNEMSGGQQQRVAVARAIVTNPSVVLADEPTANLDSATGSALLDLMERMNREKSITFIFSSHDPQVIERGRRLVMLHDGEVASEKRRG